MKPLKFDDRAKSNIMANFLEFLDGIKETPDKINYSKAIADFLPKKTAEEKESEKARLILTATAYMKMLLLMKDTTDEIGWHGIVDRIDDRTFKVIDILVFPQIVTNANVEPDAEEYAIWTMGLSDEHFNKMRFHGHSHVRFQASPSITDERYRNDMLPNLADDDYYIFFIINYDEKRHIEIFDKAKNIVYETEDISVFICDDQGNDIMTWVHIQEQQVKKRPYGQQNRPPIAATTHQGTTTTPATATETKPTETKVVHIQTKVAPGDTAYWSEILGCWVYEDKMSNRTFSTIPPRISIPNPNEKREKKLIKSKGGNPNKNKHNERSSR